MADMPDSISKSVTDKGVGALNATVADVKSDDASKIVQKVKAKLLAEEQSRIRLCNLNRSNFLMVMKREWYHLVGMLTEKSLLASGIAYPRHPLSASHNSPTPAYMKVVQTIFPFPTVDTKEDALNWQDFSKWGVMSYVPSEFNGVRGMRMAEEKITVKMPTNSSEWVKSIMDEFRKSLEKEGFKFPSPTTISWTI